MTQDIEPVDVRLALPEDRASIIALTSNLHGENGLFSISEAKVAAMIDRYYNRGLAVIAVIGEPGAVVAAIYLGIDQLSYTDDWALVEQFNFVDPEHRKSTYARQLLAYAKAVSDKMRMPLLVGILTNHRTEAKVRLYEKMLSKAGAYFLYGLDYATADAWKR